MMSEILYLILGAVGGFLVHSIAIKINFKQRTIDNKINVYDALITQWVKARNLIYTNRINESTSNAYVEIIGQLDQLYGESQRFIGEVHLVSEDMTLSTDINDINERMFRTNWDQLSPAEGDETIENIKIEALLIVERMREDIKSSTRIEWQDITHMLSGFKKTKTGKDLERHQSSD